jgi:hypothetical protein
VRVEKRGKEGKWREEREGLKEWKFMAGREGALGREKIKKI